MSGVKRGSGSRTERAAAAEQWIAQAGSFSVRQLNDRLIEWGFRPMAGGDVNALVRRMALSGRRYTAAEGDRP